MIESNAPKTPIKVFGVTCLVAPCLSAALVVAATQVRAQHLDPPLGWDVWDPTWSTREIWQGEETDETVRWRKERHEVYIDQGVPEAYRNSNNPFPRIPSVLEVGHELYAEHCASCHGSGGGGHGDAGLSLYPPPALLIHLTRLPSRVDEYLIWSIADGGDLFGSDMPAFKGTLDEQQIWQIVTYMRAGFPSTGGQEAESFLDRTGSVDTRLGVGTLRLLTQGDHRSRSDRGGKITAYRTCTSDCATVSISRRCPHNNAKPLISARWPSFAIDAPQPFDGRSANLQRP